MITDRQQADAVNTAIDHMLQHGFDDIAKPPIFKKSIELDIIGSNLEEFKRIATKEAISFLRACNLKDRGIGNPGYYMVPKDEHTFRRVAWIDPVDLIKFFSATLLVFPKIEENRVPRENNIVHSHRRSKDSNHVFDTEFGFDSFRRRSSEISKDRAGQWKVVTDISNSFDRIGNHLLENHLLDCGCDGQIIALIREVLYQWSGDRRSFGIPVGSDASRILSEAALLSIDRHLIKEGIEFVRYVDDFRLFAETRAQAYDAARILSELLAEEGLNINNRKTRVFRISEYEDGPDTTTIGVDVPHDSIDTEEKRLIQKRITVSGRTSISRYYRHPGRDALRMLEKLDIDTCLSEVMSKVGAEQEDRIRAATKYFIYVRQDLDILQFLLRAKVTSVFYIVDALVKDADRIDPNVRVMARDTVLDELGADACSYPHQIPLLRLCAAPEYEDCRLANAIVEKQRQLDNQQFFREAVPLGFQQMDRAQIRRLATQVFPVSTAPLQRAIAYAVKHYARMQEDERRPLLRNLRQTSSDWFVRNA